MRKCSLQNVRSRKGWVRFVNVLSRWVPVLVWMGVIFGVSSLTERPATPGLVNIGWDDKLQHAFAYGVLAGLLWRALGAYWLPWKRAAIAVVFALLYGAFDECHQSFVPGRECSLADWYCDATGAGVVGVLLGILYVQHGCDNLNFSSYRRNTGDGQSGARNPDIDGGDNLGN